MIRSRLLSIARWTWRHKLLAGGVILAGVVGLIVLAIRTSEPRFCASCHEMRYSYQTWHTSSHHEQSCEVCHYHPGVTGMVRTKWQGARELVAHVRERPTEAEIGPGIAKVPSEPCLKCHPPGKLPGEVTYHLLRHTHRKHVERGAQCTQCHANVVHGGKAPFKNTPTMAACLRCHDDKTAPNRCGLCHLKLGEIRPALYNPVWVDRHKENLAAIGQDACRRCHAEEFCRSCHAIARPPSHTGSWLVAHQQKTPQERKACLQCHPARGTRVEADFCTECHEARRAHGRGWLAEHPRQFQKDPDACGRCHKQEFCRDCHAIYMPHEPGWLTEHPQSARADRDRCRTCHTDTYCQDCHTKGRPASHSRNWLKTHGPAAKEAPENCRTCHRTNFCQSCHRKSPPASHRSGGWIRTHGASALADRALCSACHDSGQCASCHQGVTMPHPAGWLQLHQRRGVRESACRTCHAQEFCQACHRGSKPVSHTAAWARVHGKVAALSKAECLRCHGGSFCEVCHRVPMPHPKDIRASHSTLARGAKGRYCNVCHASDECTKCHSHNRPASHRDPKWAKQHGATEGADGRCILCHSARTCEACHGLPMPHPDDWLMGVHGQVAEKRATTCVKCHSFKDCQSCHESTPPKSHEAKDFRDKHGAGADVEAFCALCHGREAKKSWSACTTCHHGVKMPHPDGWALGHKEAGSFASDGACLACHKIDDCKVCHTNTP